MMVEPIIQFTQEGGYICQAEGYAFVCCHKNKKSHIFLGHNKGENK